MPPCPQRGTVLLLERVKLLALEEALHAAAERLLDRHAHGRLQAARLRGYRSVESVDGIVPGIWHRTVVALPQLDRLAVHRRNRRGVEVVGLKRYLRDWRVGAELLAGELLPREALGTDGHEIVEPVAAVDVHRKRNGREGMDAVTHARMVDERGERRENLFAAQERLSLPVARLVQIAALTVHQLAEDARVRRVDERHRVLVVAAVGEHHAVAAVLFRRLDDGPRLVDGAHARHLHERMDRALQRIERNLRVRGPVGVDVHGVDEPGFAQPLVALGAGERLRLAEAGLLHYVLALLRAILDEVAHSRDLHARHFAETAYGPAAASANSNHANANLLQLRRDEPDERRLARSGCRLRRAAYRRSCHSPRRTFQKRTASDVCR